MGGAVPDRPAPDFAAPLEQRLRLEPAGDDRYHAQLPGFGGVTLGCATLAAARSTSLALHSLHVYFLRPTPADRPALLRIGRVRDGRRFALRRVEVLDGDKLCCELLASFAAAGRGPDYQEQPAPPAPAPESLPDEAQVMKQEGFVPGEFGPLGGPIEFRFPDGPPWRPDEVSRYRAWARPRSPWPAEPAFHAAGLAFTADVHSHMSVARRLGYHFEPFGYTSLDQVMWVHRTEPWTDWRLLTTVSDAAGGGRAFSSRTLHARDGRLIASMGQEQFVSFAAESAP
jgi:acyl-CoA thioesterase-2